MSPLSLYLHTRPPTATPANLTGVGEHGDYYLAATPDGPCWKPFTLNRGLGAPPIHDQLPPDALCLQSLPREDEA